MSHCKCHASSSYVPARKVQIGGSVQLGSLFIWVTSVKERLFNVNKTIFKLKRASEDKRSWTSNGWQSSIICQWRRKEILRLRTVKDIQKMKIKICSRSVTHSKSDVLGLLNSLWQISPRCHFWQEKDSAGFPRRGYRDMYRRHPP